MGDKFWICGQLIGEWEETCSRWSFQGVFSNRDAAVNACRDEKYFIFSTEMNQELPHEICPAPDCCWPVIENILALGDKDND